MLAKDQRISDQFFSQARAYMVEGQVRPNNVTDPRLIAAMRLLPRERFLPPECAREAYFDTDVRLPNGRVMLSPLTMARLVQFALPRPGERALVVGAGTGYGAALVSACGAETWALEEDEGLRAIAAEALAAHAPNVHLAAGRLIEGLPGQAPFDLILIEGCVVRLPTQFARQLQVDGKLVTVLQERGLGRIVVAQPNTNGFAHRSMADSEAPLLPAFEPEPGFVF
jgi:protein-L-isoaspartate(D-aspartate) O-methyltransferase